jgi:hypothetical protein
MAYLIPDNLKTHISSNIIDDITRGDATIITEQIEVGIAEAKSYCSRFDLTKLFDDTDAEFVDDKNLLSKVKDIVCWHVLTLSNKNVRIDLFSKRYDDAIAWLKMVQSGKADPDWPVPSDDEDTDKTEGSDVQFISNDRQTHRY